MKIKWNYLDWLKSTNQLNRKSRDQISYQSEQFSTLCRLYIKIRHSKIELHGIRIEKRIRLAKSGLIVDFEHGNNIFQAPVSCITDKG